MMIKLNYRIYIFENMGVAANKPCPRYDVVPRALLVKIFRNHYWYVVSENFQLVSKFEHSKLLRSSLTFLFHFLCLLGRHPFYSLVDDPSVLFVHSVFEHYFWP